MNSLDIEVVLKNHSTISQKDIVKICKLHLNTINIIPSTIISKFDNVKNFILNEDVAHIIIGETDVNNAYINLSEVDINWYVYSLDTNGPQMENCEREGGDIVNLATHYVLPSEEFFSLWENLVYDSKVKEHLLNYAQTMIEFSDCGVDSNIISCNRVILLHGPPGTGKTSLCKALAQKLCIKMQKRFKHGLFVEINAHSLFSKWFSESGKLVTKMFSEIKQLVEDPKALVCVLIDEIESLAHARDQCMSGNEPSDSIRVVNAVLTQIDQIKRYPNVIILTTSNMTGAIDIAFVDRADVKQYLGLPGIRTIYQIYHSCIEELLKVGVLHSSERVDNVNIFNIIDYNNTGTGAINGNTRQLIELSEKSKGLSGRTLRRIPFLAHALYTKRKCNSFDTFLEAMNKAVHHELQQQKHF